MDDRWSPRKRKDVFELKKDSDPIPDLRKSKTANTQRGSSGPAKATPQKGEGQQKRTPKKGTPKKMAETSRKPALAESKTPTKKSSLGPKEAASPASARKRKKIAEEDGVREFLLHTEHNAEYEKAISERDASYADLYAKYTKLKDLYDKNQAQVFEDCRAASSASEKQATAIILAQKKELVNKETRIAQLTEELAALKHTHSQTKKEVAKLEKQVGEHTVASAKLQEDLGAVQKMYEQSLRVQKTYQLFTAMEIKHMKKNLFYCKIVAHNPYRVVEFTLNSLEEEIVYKPMRVSLKTDYDGYLKTSVCFDPNQTPLLMRNLIAAAYTEINDEAPTHSKVG